MPVTPVFSAKVRSTDVPSVFSTLRLHSTAHTAKWGTSWNQLTSSVTFVTKRSQDATRVTHRQCVRRVWTSFIWIQL